MEDALRVSDNEVIPRGCSHLFNFIIRVKLAKISDSFQATKELQIIQVDVWQME
jgi:hypothetical protein